MREMRDESRLEWEMTKKFNWHLRFVGFFAATPQKKHNLKLLPVTVRKKVTRRSEANKCT